MPTAPDTVYIFTTSPTGLGHIRVMDALIEGLPQSSLHQIIGIDEVSAAKIHALGSRIPFFLKLTEFVQNTPLVEKLVTSFYKFYFASTSSGLVSQLEKIKLNFPDVQRWVIVSTHFALAYPIVATKASLAKKFDVEILNVLIVTDDSPQRVWAVQGCDFIFTPSDYTETILRSFLPKDTTTIIETVSFPVSPRLTVPLSESEITLLENQLNPTQNSNLHICVPVGGAATQLDYLSDLISTLAREKFIFTVIGRLTLYSQMFFDKLIRIPHVQVSTGDSARLTVNLYESSFYQGLRPACEITKPSEQAFKAILRPNQRGGVILLLTDPVGRQERDNLNFLIRHELLPNDVEQQKLEKYLVIDGVLPESEKNMIHYKASHWRALKLPNDPKAAYTFIKNAKKEELLYSMLSYVAEPNKALRSDGVAQIWNHVAEMIRYRSNG